MFAPMKIIGLEGLTPAQVGEEVQRGGKFVLYEWTFSVLIMSFKRNSDVHFMRSGVGRVGPGLKYCAASFFLGWWGFPWGPIWTISTIVTNLGGGKDITSEMLYILSAEGDVPGKEQ